jgi:hypothetical protein
VVAGPPRMPDERERLGFPNGRELSPRLQRTLELAYEVEGVVAARVWQWPGRIAVGVRGGKATSPPDLVRRVEAAVAGLREPGETWDFGILEDSANAPH